jgi:hypothetical protein
MNCSIPLTLSIAFIALPSLSHGQLPQPKSVPVHRAFFAAGGSSTGWIDFEFFNEDRIFIPAKINGHNAVLTFATGDAISHIDKSFAATIANYGSSAFNPVVVSQ